LAAGGVVSAAPSPSCPSLNRQYKLFSPISPPYPKYAAMVAFALSHFPTAVSPKFQRTFKLL